MDLFYREWMSCFFQITSEVRLQVRGSWLPDPSTIKDRSELFAVSLRLCGYSSMESFGDDNDDDMARSCTDQGGRKTTRSMWESDGSVGSQSMLSEDDDLSLLSGTIDHASIAFSMDSIHVRRQQQCNKSQSTDWAIDDSQHDQEDKAYWPEYHEDVGHNTHTSFSRFGEQQPVYEFDMMPLHEHQAKKQRESGTYDTDRMQL